MNGGRVDGERVRGQRLLGRSRRLMDGAGASGAGASGAGAGGAGASGAATQVGRSRRAPAVAQVGPAIGVQLARSVRWVGLAAVVWLIGLVGCHVDGEPLGQTLEELVLDQARTCRSDFFYPQALVDGLSHQLVSLLVCREPSLLTFYTSCREPGCINAEGPQPHAARPEVVAALVAAAEWKHDFITIHSAYRDVGLQYYSRWYRENCSSSFAAAVPGASNHQGGRAVDVRYYNHWWSTLERFGFEHPLPDDRPHFEYRGNSSYREQSRELQRLSVRVFQELWNHNHPGDRIAEDGVYGTSTRLRLGASPVSGFPSSPCVGVVVPDPGDEPDAGDGPWRDVDGVDVRDADRDVLVDVHHEVDREERWRPDIVRPERGCAVAGGGPPWPGGSWPAWLSLLVATLAGRCRLCGAGRAALAAPRGGGQDGASARGRGPDEVRAGEA